MARGSMRSMSRRNKRRPRARTARMRARRGDRPGSQGVVKRLSVKTGLGLGRRLEGVKGIFQADGERGQRELARRQVARVEDEMGSRAARGFGAAGGVHSAHAYAYAYADADAAAVYPSISTHPTDTRASHTRHPPADSSTPASPATPASPDTPTSPAPKTSTRPALPLIQTQPRMHRMCMRPRTRGRVGPVVLIRLGPVRRIAKGTLILATGLAHLTRRFWVGGDEAAPVVLQTATTLRVPQDFFQARVLGVLGLYVSH